MGSRWRSGGQSTWLRPTWLSEICWKIYVEICWEICWETCCWGIFSWTGSKKHNMMEQCCEYRVDILMRALSKKLKHIAAQVDWNHSTAPKHRSNISQEHSWSLNNIQATSFNIKHHSTSLNVSFAATKVQLVELFKNHGLVQADIGEIKICRPRRVNVGTEICWEMICWEMICWEMICWEICCCGIFCWEMLRDVDEGMMERDVERHVERHVESLSGFVEWFDQRPVEIIIWVSRIVMRFWSPNDMGQKKWLVGWYDLWNDAAICKLITILRWAPLAVPVPCCRHHGNAGFGFLLFHSS